MERETINKLLGIELRKERIRCKYTLDQVREKMNYNSRQTILNYENGIRSIQIDVLMDLCNIYKVPYYELLERVVKQLEK